MISPILRRELLSVLRSRRAFQLLVLAVASASLVPLLRWPRSRSAQDGAATFVVFAHAQISALFLLIPAFTAGTIAGERDAGTFDMLWMTRLSPRSIVLAKAAAAGVHATVMLIACVPAACAFHLLGGVSFRTTIEAYGVTFLSAVLAVMIGLVQSERGRSTAQAALRGVVWVILWQTGPLLLFALMVWWSINAFSDTVPNRGQFTRWADSAFFWILTAFTVVVLWIGTLPFLYPMAPALSPYAVLYLAVIEPTAVGRELPVVGYAIFACLGAFAHLRYVARNLGPAPSVPEVLRPALPLIPRPPGPGRRAWLAARLLAAGRAGSRLVRNPVFLREVSTETHSALSYRAIIFWATLVLGCAALAGFSTRGPFLAALAVAIIVVPAAAAPAVAREVETASFELLRGTLLTSGEILRGKALAALSSIAGIVTAPLILTGWLACVVAGNPRHESPGAAAVLASGALYACILLVTALSWTAVSIFASVVARRVMWALVGAYVGAFATAVALPLGVSFALGSIPDLLAPLSPFVLLLHGARGDRESMPPMLLTGLCALVHGVAALIFTYLARIRLERSLLRTA